MQDIRKRIETWLAENAQPMLAALNPGVTPAEIAEIEKGLGFLVVDRFSFRATSRSAKLPE
jgi:cell wall assembly regulator SMI1